MYESTRREDLPRLSRALRTRSNDRNHAISNCGSFIFPCIGVIRTFGLNARAVFAATLEVVSGTRSDVVWDRRTHQGFALFYILFPEQKLAIQVGEVYSVEIKQSDMPEPG